MEKFSWCRYLVHYHRNRIVVYPWSALDCSLGRYKNGYTGPFFVVIGSSYLNLLQISILLRNRTNPNKDGKFLF